MWIEKLVLRNFRNYECAEIDLCRGTNMIHGENAQGKTNLLEAFSLLSTGKSFRTIHLADIIRSGASFFHIEALFYKEGVDQTLSLYFDGKTKKIQYNGSLHTTFSSLLGILPSIFIVPEDISIVTGSPASRRHFIDLHIAQKDPLYVYHLGRYMKAMKQRNTLLKQQTTSGIAPWEQIMASASAYLYATREQHIKDLIDKARPYLNLLTEGADTLDIHFERSFPPSTSSEDPTAFYFLRYQKMRGKELHLKTTLQGPHRDDIHFFIRSKEAKLYASQGQIRSLVTSLYLGQRDLLEESLGTSPIVGIDDFGCHLDAKRSAMLIKHTSSLGQIFLTSPTEFSLEPIEVKKRFLIEQGRIRHENIEKAPSN
ncbi:MAG: DNA replication/repair protein RecF [Chlamydiae bacterium]|nr:DNA replication/repair protein RecF [Chlamydiota bacterium]